MWLTNVGTIEKWWDSCHLKLVFRWDIVKLSVYFGGELGDGQHDQARTNGGKNLQPSFSVILLKVLENHSSIRNSVEWGSMFIPSSISEVGLSITNEQNFCQEAVDCWSNSKEHEHDCDVVHSGRI